jgi:prepilin-type N-terminal cleavage/methylation domain-containing protein
MKIIKTKQLQKGFTLIEVLLVIVLIGILISIGLVTFNAEARFIDTRNDTRKTHIQTLESAITQYKLQEGDYPTGLSRNYQEICDPEATDCIGFFDLKQFLVPNYLQSIPQDPNDEDTTGGAGYSVAVDEATNTVSVRALQAEGGVIINTNDPLPAEPTTVSNTPLAATVPVTPPPPQAGFDFSITPPISGKTEWNLLLDGDLNLSTHGEWTIIPSRNITVNTKIWGAGGASGAAWTTSNPLTETSRMGDGGGGGYSTGSLVLTSGTPYIIQVGEGGSRRNGIDVNGGATYRAGGSNSNTGGAQGGGYSGIFITSVIQSNTLIIAGGGGAGYDRDGSWCSSSGSLGAGGGSNAQNGFSAGNQGGRGATQSAGGGPSIYNNTTAGSALRGGLAGSGNFHSGGGGGGYFGGGGGNICGGGGGSGFINSTLVTNGLTQTGNGSTPANSSDTMRSGSGQGSSSTSKGSDGRIILTLNTI